ncbi:MAG: 4Fe-4S dicluster domain-containing protein [Firmicutes bacterium]|nr:4Fe-4S dicluster domain-containing protein [Bacillota bacterium]
MAKYAVELVSRLCKGCEICVEVCPRDVLVMTAQAKATVAVPEQCIGCNLCEWHCPDFAITVKEAATNE